MDDQKYREVVHFLSSTEKKYPEYMYSMSDERKRSVVKSNFRQFAASYKLNQREDGFRGSSIELHLCSKEGLESRRH
ncbi:hypothetical protein ACOMHN_013206 [Nucella lapillus]